jgi:peptide/nickel transport system substrate-binding protein
MTRDVDRRGFLRMVGAMSAAAAITGSVAACGGPSSTGGSAHSGSTPNLDGTIEAGISYTLSSGFDPMTASGATPVAANMHVFEGLVDLDPVTREPYAALATAMPQQVNSTTYRASLRKGATFHDGSPVTADDVVFSFTRILDPKNASLMVQFLPFLDSVRAVDASTVEFRLTYGFPLFPTRVSVVKIVPKKIVEADQKAFDAKPVGSGPYRLVEATKQDKIVFARWDTYNGPRPAKAAAMNWRLVDNNTARVNALVSGRVEAIEDVPYVDVATVKGKAQTESVQSFGNLFLMFNYARRPFDDKRVRQALHYALDVDKIVTTAMYGQGIASTSYLQPSHPDYHRAATVYGHDPARAKELLAAAGASGLKVTLTTTNTGWVSDIAPLIKESWDAIGVRTTLDVGESSGQYAKVDGGDFQVMAAPGDPSVFGNDADLLLSWFYGAGVWTTKRFRWAGSQPDVQVRGLLDQAARASDRTARSRYWSQAIDVIADQAVLYPVVHRKLPTAWEASKLSGFKPLPTTGLSFLGVSTT